MNFLRKLLAHLLDLMAVHVLNGLDKRQLPYIAALDTRLDRIEKMLERSLHPFLAVAVKNEVQHLDQLPRSLLVDHAPLAVVGCLGADIEATLPGCRVLPVDTWLGFGALIRPEAQLGTLLFLDEYYFVRAMDHLAAPAYLVIDGIVFPARFDHVAEARCRMALHQLGFIEVALVAAEAVSGTLKTYAISHASPITCDPVFIDDARPPMMPGDPVAWVVARKFVATERKEGGHA